MEIRNIVTGEITTVEEVISNTYTEEKHKEMLNEEHDIVVVCGFQYLAGELLYHYCYADFRADYLDALNSLIVDTEDEVAHSDSSVYLADGNTYELVK